MISDYSRYRIYEMIPGIMIWGVFSALFILSFIMPMWVIYFIIVFDVYWVFRVVYFSIFLLTGWRKFRKARIIDWTEKLYKIPAWDEYYHLIFLPIYDESYEILETTLKNIVQSEYKKENFIIVMAGEERKKEHFESVKNQALKDFDGKFGKILVTLHPADKQDEIPGKGSNIHFAGHEAKKYIDDLEIPYENVIVSSFDVDTVVNRHYFAYLTHEYANSADPVHTSFQPVALYNNNIWESQSFVRIMAFGTTFWLLFAQTRPDTLVTFSSHSMSFKALSDVGFWQKDVISEDSRIFWQCFIHYRGNYKTHPLYIPVSMDTARDEKWYGSLKSIYKQQRRWAWGTENIPYLFWKFREAKKNGINIPFSKRFKHLFSQMEGKFSWATTAVLLLVFGRLPLITAGTQIKQTSLFQNTPHILEILMSIAMFGILVSMLLSLPLLPPPPNYLSKKKIFNKITMVLQWILLPVSLLLVSAVPAVEAETRLMMGKYLGFNVSQKKRKKA